MEDAESHAPVGNYALVYEESGSGANCTLEFNGVSGSSGCLEENAISDSAGIFQKVQTMQSDERLYKLDIVQCRETKGLIGMVIKVAGDSDSDSTSGSSEDEYEDEGESIPDDSARIVWTNHSETTEKISDIEVLDRVFFPGEFVAATSDPSGQVGIVVDVDLTVDLLTPTSVTIKNVSSRNLQRIRAFLLDDHVFHGSWVGRVDKVIDNVTVIFDDGSKCKLMEADPGRLIPISHNFCYPYFPGQRVRGSSSAVFKNALWLCGKWNKNLIEGTVGDVEIGSVDVDWFPKRNPGSRTIPARLQDPKQLKLLSYFSYARWFLGDWCLLSASEKGISEVTLPVTDDVHGALFVCNKRTKVDVLWQDGTRTRVNSRTLFHIDDLGDHDFFPEQFVLEKGSDDNAEASEARRVGIVKSVDSKERTARVRWMKPIKSLKDALKFDVEKLVSVYELAQYPDYDYFVGDIVVCLSPVSKPGIVNQLICFLSFLMKSLLESDLSMIGNIIDVRDGALEVAWADGTVSKISKVEKDGKHDAARWEPVDSDSTDLAEFISSTIDIKHTKEEDIVHSLPSSCCHQSCHFKRFDSVKNPVGHHYQNETGKPISEQKWMKKVQQEWNILEKNLPDSIFVRVYEDRMDLLRAVVVGAAGTPYQNGLFFFDIHIPVQYPDGPPLVYYHSGGLRLNPNLYECGKVCLSLLNTWTGKRNEVWNPTSSNLLQVLVSIQGLVLNAKPYFNEPGLEKQNGSVEGEKNSLTYNENSFLLSCKSMLYILHRPPKHFEMFVKEHFQRRGYCILRACDAYVKGAQLGSLSEDCLLPLNVGAESTENHSTSSVGFKLMLLKIVPKLVSSFSEIGVDCQKFQDHRQAVKLGPSRT